LGARLDGIEEVAGSNPAGSTRISMTFFVYILQSESTGRYYIGQTKNLEERVTYHNANYSKALRNRGPWKLVYTEPCASRGDALRRENYIKRQKDRKFIEALVARPGNTGKVAGSNLAGSARISNDVIAFRF
jgi:putative endonuclease